MTLRSADTGPATGRLLDQDFARVWRDPCLKRVAVFPHWACTCGTLMHVQQGLHRPGNPKTPPIFPDVRSRLPEAPATASALLQVDRPANHK